VNSNIPQKVLRSFLPNMTESTKPPLPDLLKLYTIRGRRSTIKSQRFMRTRKKTKNFHAKKTEKDLAKEEHRKEFVEWSLATSSAKELSIVGGFPCTEEGFHNFFLDYSGSYQHQIRKSFHLPRLHSHHHHLVDDIIYHAYLDHEKQSNFRAKKDAIQHANPWEDKHFVDWCLQTSTAKRLSQAGEFEHSPEGFAKFFAAYDGKHKTSIHRSFKVVHNPWKVVDDKIAEIYSHPEKTKNFHAKKTEKDLAKEEHRKEFVEWSLKTSSAKELSIAGGFPCTEEGFHNFFQDYTGLYQHQIRKSFHLPPA